MVLSARCAAVVRTLVVLAARHAGVVRAPVVRSAGCAQPDFVRNVVLIDARYAARGPVRNVIQTTGSSCWCGSFLPLLQAIGSDQSPNKAL